MEKPLDSIEISDLRFDLDKMIKKQEPVELQPTFVINNSQTTQTLSRSIEYTTSTSEYFESTDTMQFGVKFVVKIAPDKAVPPGLNDFSIRVAVGYSGERSETTGRETIETYTDTIEAQVEVSEKSKVDVTITANKNTASVPWSGIETKTYTDGTVVKSKKTGIYKGVHINEVAVQYGEETDLTQEQSCRKRLKSPLRKNQCQPPKMPIHGFANTCESSY